METIDLSKFEPQETLNHTSKGNQLKWKCDGYWYKADHMGYEGLAETIVSALLAKSTVKYSFVAYLYLVSSKKYTISSMFLLKIDSLDSSSPSTFAFAEMEIEEIFIRENAG